MKKTLLFLMLSVCLTSPAKATEPLTLAEALTTADKNHPQIEEAAANLSAAEAKFGQAKANYWPQINLAADWNKGDTFLTALGGIKETEVSTTSVVVRQNLYDFGRTAGATAAARGAKAAAAEGVTVSRQDVAFRVKGAWYLVLAAEKQVEASRKTVAAREGLARQAGEFFRHGIRSKVEVARTEASLFAGKSLLIRAENNRDLARLELANAMGLNSLEDRPLAEPETIADPAPEDLASLREEALRSRGELKRLPPSRMQPQALCVRREAATSPRFLAQPAMAKPPRASSRKAGSGLWGSISPCRFFPASPPRNRCVSPMPQSMEWRPSKKICGCRSPKRWNPPGWGSPKLRPALRQATKRLWQPRKASV